MSKIKRIGKDMPIIMYGNQMLGEGAYSRVYKGILEDTK